MADNRQKKGSLIWFTLLSSVVVMVVALFTISNETFRNNLNIEINSAREHLHADDWQKIEVAMNARFERMAIRSGFMHWLSVGMLPAAGTEDNFINNLLPNGINYRFVNNVQYTLYQASFRWHMMQFWILTMLPVVIAFSVTGYYRWKIKHFSMDSGKTIAIKLVLSGLITLVSALIFYMIAPSFGLPGSYYIPAFIILAIGYLAGRAISSFHLDV